MQTVKLLWLLQEIEKKEKELQTTCRANPILQDLRKTKEQLSARQKDFENQKEIYRILSQKIKALEEEIKVIMAKQTEILKKMYDGTVTQSKELTQMQQQSQQLKNKALNFEEEQLQQMEEKERLYTVLKNEQQILGNDINSFKTQKMQYDLEKLNIEQEIAQLGDEKERILSQLPTNVLQKFREAQKNYNGMCVTFVGPNRLCSFCRVEIPRTIVIKAQQDPGKVHCESCGRMLYIE